jgi:hypothetical protein
MPLAALLLLAAAPPAGHCAITVSAAADRSFAQTGYDANPRRLSDLAAATRERFVAAARRLCSAGALRPADLARFRKLIVQNGEGATEPVLYQDPSMAPDMFIFQYAFQNGGPPPPKAFESALRCWKTPERAGCYQD